MHALHILTSKSFGGLELYCLDLVVRLHGSGIFCSLYCVPGSRVAQEAAARGIDVILAPIHCKTRLGHAWVLRRYLRAHHTDILHSHTRQDVFSASCALVGLSKKHKHVFSLYMSAPRKKDPLHRFIYKRVDAITSSSEILNTQIELNFPVPKSKIHLVRYGRDSSVYLKDFSGRDAFRKQLGVGPQECIVGCLSRIDEGKGIRDLASSFLFIDKSLQQKVHYWIIGEPTLQCQSENGEAIYEPQAKSLYEWLKEFAVSQIDPATGRSPIKLLPFHKDIIPLLNAMDIFVLPTQKETYSLSVLDAMSMGLPVIGTHSGGTPEQVLQGERGCLVPSQDPKAIASAVTHYIKSPADRATHGENARTWVQKHHNWGKTIEDFMKIYHSSL